jgi:hypothetical protein
VVFRLRLLASREVVSYAVVFRLRLLACGEVVPYAAVFHLRLMAREEVHLNKSQERNQFRRRGRGSVGVTMML